MLFIQTLFVNPVVFLMTCLIVVFSVCLHEYFHAAVAVHEGDYTAAEHLTLNPLRQMGFMSLLMLAFFGIAWGAVPVDSSLLRSRWSLLRVSLAGPAANLLLLLLAWCVCLILGLPSVQTSLASMNQTIVTAVYLFTMTFGIYNFVLLVFNLIPMPGLDGWNILSAVFPKIQNVHSEFIKGAMLLVMLLAFFCVNILFAAGSFIMMLAPRLAWSIGG
ncbi:MAG: site-2 protease family protein [Lentisphaeria bacterium]|nr:site-2 protease family protein [Lentisphaeria bacterium]